MMEVLQSLFSFFVAITIVVGVHEYGHLLMARLCGVQVLRFSIGFGSPLWSWRSIRSGIEYVIAPIPLGGYVQMKGQNDFPTRESDSEAEVARDDSESEPDRDRSESEDDPASPSRTTAANPPEKDSYATKPVPQRILIASGGPLFNFLFSAVALTVLAWMGYGLSKPIIKPIPESELHRQGVRAGDIVVAINGRKIEYAQDILTNTLTSAVDDGVVELKIHRPNLDESFEVYLSRPDDTDAETFIQSVFTDEIAFLGPPAIIGNLSEDFPVSRSGLRGGDRILAINDTPILDFGDLVRLIQTLPDQSITLDIERDGDHRRLQSRTLSDPENSRIGVLGVGLDTQNPRFEQWVRDLGASPSLAKALLIGVESVYDLIILTVRSVGWIISGSISLDSLKGPVGIAGYAGDSIERGFETFLNFIALISVSIGVLNLLPIPVLDGGHILLLIWEGVMGKPMREPVVQYLTYFGILFIGSLFLFTLVNDLSLYL